jgi:crossover junction endodeoxyribonuclease RuvC
MASLRIHEYTPLQVKIATTGYGRGTKAQIIAMLHRLIAIDKTIRHDDEYDAIAIGLTCLASTSR